MNRHAIHEQSKREAPVRTVIPVRRDTGLFPGWGVRL